MSKLTLSLCRASYPAGAAGALVSDLPHGGALGPLLTCVKGVGKPHAFNVMKSVSVMK